MSEQYPYASVTNEAESRLRALLANHSLGIIEVTPDGAVTMASRTLGDWLGREPAMLSGSMLAEIMPREDHAQLMRQLAKLVDESIDSTALAHRFVNLAGEEVWVRSTWSARRADGRAVTHLIAIVEDIARERHEELVRSILEESIRGLEERRRYVDAMLDGLPVIVWRALPSGVCEYLSPEWRAFTGLCDGTGHRWLAAVHSDDRARFAGVLANLSASRSAGHSTEPGEPHRMLCRLRRHDGTFHTFDILWRPMSAEGDTIRAWTGVCVPVAAAERPVMTHTSLEIGEPLAAPIPLRTLASRSADTSRSALAPPE